MIPMCHEILAHYLDANWYDHLPEGGTGYQQGDSLPIPGPGRRLQGGDGSGYALHVYGRDVLCLDIRNPDRRPQRVLPGVPASAETGLQRGCRGCVVLTRSVSLPEPWAGVARWLAQILAHPLPNRSIDAYRDVIARPLS
jgi:hypothetical protein